MDLIKEFLLFLTRRKKLWLLPLLIIIVLIGTMLILSQGSVFAPFIYTLF
jgi:hypothetical protein